MKTKNNVIFLLALIVTAGFTQAEETSEKELSNTHYAEVELRITTDPKVLPILIDGQGAQPHIQPLIDLMIGKQMPENIAKETIGKSNWDDILEISDTSSPREIGGLQVAQLKLTVSLDDSYKPAAKEFLETYIQKLEEALRRESGHGKRVFEYKLEHYRRQKHEIEMLLEGLLKAQNSLAGESGALDKESVRQRIYEHEQKIIEINIQQSILKKRAESFAMRMHELEIEMKVMEEKDPIIRHLREQMVKQETTFEELRKKAIELKRNIPSIAESKTLLNETKDNLAKRKSDIQKALSIKTDELNRQLRETAIQQEELEIHEVVLHGHRPASLSDSMEYEILEVKIAAARESLHRATIEVSKADSECRLIMSPEIRVGKISAAETLPKSQ